MTAISTKIPHPQDVRQVIGQLLRELKVARRLLAVSKLAEEQLRDSQDNGLTSSTPPTPANVTAAH